MLGLHSVGPAAVVVKHLGGGVPVLGKAASGQAALPVPHAHLASAVEYVSQGLLPLASSNGLGGMGERAEVVHAASGCFEEDSLVAAVEGAGVTWSVGSGHSSQGLFGVGAAAVVVGDLGARLYKHGL